MAETVATVPGLKAGVRGPVQGPPREVLSVPKTPKPSNPKKPNK